MSRDGWLPPEEWIGRRPKVVVSAGALFTDDVGRVLVVKPNYRDHWLFVGGGLDEDETPEQACRREVKEEIGLDVEVGRLLVVDWTLPSRERPLPLLVFLFDGGAIRPEQIRLDGDELDEFRFVPVDEALNLLSRSGRRRLPVALEAKRTGTTRYLS
ncbi:NUDIX domain-containing protein [Glycomyces sp. NPDC048151]|uniref:NUDIX domain-containing protein n=1 Tax=Glycomyces sp. NPDC048151 TaxID=3364002 RepID=UPI0037180A75